jgi:RNA polymerase sporulation-specific sigma factor
MYETVDEQVLLKQAAQGNEQAVDQLLSRYKNLVRRKASMMYMAGSDTEDVIQEGMMGLLKAIRAYDPQKKVPFAAFASYCIMSQITDAVRKASRKKHQVLNESVSLQSPAHVSDGERDLPLMSFISSGSETRPDQVLQNQEDMTNLIAFIRQDLSPLERNAVLLFIQNLSYRQIADCLGVPVKSIDNALSRARRKFTQYREKNGQRKKRGDDT